MRICEHNGCHFPVFGTDKITKKGYCKLHQSKRTDKKKKTFSRASVKTNEGKIRTYVKSNRIFENAKAESRKHLEEWFDSVIKVIDKNPYCWNCGKYIAQSFRRAACAHIIPKRKTYGFPSVATHEMNYVVLGAGCGCHSKYDNSWEDAIQMKVWPIAVERFKAFKEFIDEGELKNLPDVLIQIK